MKRRASTAGLLSFLASSILAALASPLLAQAPIEAEAIVGQPFGVGRIVLDLPEDALPQPLGVSGIGLTEKDGRIFYPAIDSPAFGKLMKEFLDLDTPLTSGGPLRAEVGGVLRGVLDRPPRTTIYFLFRGVEPLRVLLQLRRGVDLTIVPRPADLPSRPGRFRRPPPDHYERLLRLWWQHYARPARLLESKPDYPPLVDTYLTATLARRLDLRLPDAKQTAPAEVSLRKEIGFNLGTEPLRTAMLQDRILGLNNLNLPADEPLPMAIEPPPLGLPPSPADLQVEPIAIRVPAECFYVRFGSFANFIWLQDTLAKWGGDARNLIALRGLDRGMKSHFERQLVLKETVLSRMLGDTVIADVAIIGTDTFFREGASFGILFQARSNLALSRSLSQQRQERLAAGGVKEEKLTIDGHAVSLLISPDGRVRSYYVADGDFHFIATSKALVARFLATASGGGSLGKSDEFRHARTRMPMSRGDTIWFYASDAFFRNITSPLYRIEMTRRLQAAAGIELVELARLDAACEGKPGATIQQLISGRFLPPEFGPLPDGSHTVMQSDDVFDSLRGRVGSFVPIPDVGVDRATRAEAADYQRFADFYAENWGEWTR